MSHKPRQRLWTGNTKSKSLYQLTLPLTIVLPDGTHKVITEEDFPELPVKTEDLIKREHPIKK